MIHLRQLQNGRYKIVSVISRGGFGVTYKALRQDDNAIVCIKEFYNDSICRINPQTGVTESLSPSTAALFNKFKDSFIKEGRTLQHLRCDNIVKVYDVFEEGGTAYYVMEYIDGEPLSEIIPANGLDASAALNIIGQVLSAAKYIHDRRITHLDIKPSNILVCKNAEIVLIDFGGSKRYTEDGEQTSSSPLSKSEGFAPIELYNERALDEFSPATDMYEIGATLYNLVTGKVPPSASEIMDEGNPIVNIDVPANIKNAILLSMEPSLKRRISSVEQFEQCLAGGAIDDTTILDDATDVSDTAVIDDEASADTDSRPRKSKKYLFIVLAAVILVVIILAVRNINSKKYDIDDCETVEVEALDSTEMIKEELAEFVSRQNSKPRENLAGIQIDSLALTDTGLEYFISISSAGQSIYKELKKGESVRKNYVLTAMKNDAKLLDICQKLIKLDLNLIWHYRYTPASDEIIIEIMPSDLADIRLYEGDSSDRKKQQFTDMARNISNQCPQVIDEDLTMTGCEFIQNNIIYYYNCSSEFYDYVVSNLREYKSDIESQYDSDEAMKSFMKICAEQDVNIKFEYKCLSRGKTITLKYNTSTNKFI